jgi:putative endonuclease
VSDEGGIFTQLFRTVCHSDPKAQAEESNTFSLYLRMFHQEGYHTYYIYIITNKTKTVLYTGVTNNLRVRLQQHKENILLNKETFASKYNTQYLLYYEKFTWIQEAIAREKEIKKWRREKKTNLIKTINPNFEFLNYLFENRYEIPSSSDTSDSELAKQ